ncbi:Transcription elongation factor A N-terminal and central domain-containing protein 2 [Daphnia magna]|uniref:Transcription elongation factor A N-terminal and central domain-containing protein 2 n=2 Tax=Daphnia magna TaxID=35525 RepID=A0A0P5SEF2_9CRUS|nr:Transcription elongation factor A N-terminal and central domain-containing protein 2 [Daphnia magna]
MDKFLIKKTKEPPSSGISRGMKQASLHQLGGVVILEDLTSANQQLSNPEISPDQKIYILNKLKNKKPAKEILKSTGIGRTVHRLCRDENPIVSCAANEVYGFWKTHILHLLRRKPIEVESDAETKRGRASAKKMINLALNNSVIAEEIEIHVFNKCKKIMNHTYNRVIRKIHFCFKGNEDQKRRVNEMNSDLKEFVEEMYRDVIKVYAKQ